MAGARCRPAHGWLPIMDRSRPAGVPGAARPRLKRSVSGACGSAHGQTGPLKRRTYGSRDCPVDRLSIDDFLRSPAFSCEKRGPLEHLSCAGAVRIGGPPARAGKWWDRPAATPGISPLSARPVNRLKREKRPGLHLTLGLPRRSGSPRRSVPATIRIDVSTPYGAGSSRMAGHSTRMTPGQAVTRGYQ